MEETEIAGEVQEAAQQAAFPMQKRWRSRFHLEIPFGVWQNPGGIIFHNGEYHVYCPWHRRGKDKTCWFHLHTRDFVHYSRPERVDWPELQTDAAAGCVYLEEGKLQMLSSDAYHPEDGMRSICLHTAHLGPHGRVEAGESFSLDIPHGYAVYSGVPSLFERGGRRYLALGAQNPQKRGCVLLYVEAGDGWYFQDELHTQLTAFGTSWEAPRLLRFGLQDALLLSPQGVAAEPCAYENACISGYLAGEYSVEGKALLHGDFQELDHGFDFYAPHYVSHEGRNILIGWLGMPGQTADYPSVPQGWRYVLTMPRMLMLRRGHIYAQPVAELKALRILDTAQEALLEHTRTASIGLPETAELLLDISLGRATILDFTLAYGLERIYMHYDREQQLFRISREAMKLGGRGVRTFRLNGHMSFSLQLFVDKTVVELFLQHGEETASFFVFPEKNIVPEFSVAADADMDRVAMQTWELDALRFSVSS